MNPQETKEYKPLELKINLRPNGNYELQGFSIKTLRALEQWHNQNHNPRKWKLNKDEQTLYLY